MDDLDRSLIDLFAAEPADRRARGVAPARRRPRHRAGPARQARRRRGVITRLGPGLSPRGARLPGDRVPHPGDPAGSGLRRHDAVGRPCRGSRRCWRRTRSPAPATCGAASSPGPTPTSSGSSTRCSPPRHRPLLDGDRPGHPGPLPRPARSGRLTSAPSRRESKCTCGGPCGLVVAHGPSRPAPATSTPPAGDGRSLRDGRSVGDHRLEHVDLGGRPGRADGGQDAGHRGQRDVQRDLQDRGSRSP